MKVVITGGCGFIGSHLADAWLARGAEVVVIDNLATGRKENLDPRAQLIVKSLQDLGPQDQQIFDGTDYLFHLGALASIVPSIKEPLAYFDSNVSGTVRLLEIAKGIEGLKKFVYTASGSCYGIPDTYPTPETAAIRPEYPYAFTKWQGEELVRHWGLVYDLPWISLRLTNVFGPRSRTDTGYGAVFGVFLAQLANQRPLTIVGDGEQSRDFTFVGTVCDVIADALARHVVCDTPVNLAFGSRTTLNALVGLLEVLLGRPVAREHTSPRPGDVRDSQADATLLHGLFPGVRAVPLPDGLQATVSWFESRALASGLAGQPTTT